MIYPSKQMEEQAVLATAAHMCAAARTAPKATGKDVVHTLVLTGEDKAALADKMIEIGKRGGVEAWMSRDAENVRSSQAVVLVGVKRSYRGVRHCGFCGFETCGACKSAGANCAMMYIDLGIALSSAVQAAAIGKVDNRIMLSIGEGAMEMHYTDEDVLWHGIPLSVTGKSGFFDRK